MLSEDASVPRLRFHDRRLTARLCETGCMDGGCLARDCLTLASRLLVGRALTKHEKSASTFRRSSTRKQAKMAARREVKSTVLYLI